MDVYRTEEEQVEAIKKWWSENGKAIVAGVIIGLSTIFGWRAWDNHLNLQAEAASILYEQMLEASRKDDSENTRIYADRIISDYGSTAYASFANLMLAKLSAESSNFENAEDHLRRVIENSSQPEIEHVARLRLARVLIAGNKLELALETLNDSEPGKFIAQYEELHGDIYLKQGKNKEAQQAYINALTDTAITEEAQSILQMKLDNIGGT